MHSSIVVGTDGSDPAEAAVREAVEIAGCDGARLHIVTAFKDPEHYGERITGGADTVTVSVRNAGEALLARAGREADAKGVEYETHTRDGDAADTIIRIAEEQHADLIVVGHTARAGIPPLPLGSVSQKVLHHAPCSVLIVRGGGAA
jgi:nucleotide-binding universal stress UspA family protein